MKPKKPKRKTWQEKHNEKCDRIRASVGAKAGDGLKLLQKMQEGTEVQRELAKCYRHMSANAADAILSLYASNPTMRLLMEAQHPALHLREPVLTGETNGSSSGYH